AERDFVSAVLDTANALVLVLDREGRITRFNRACERLTGYTFAEVRGVPFWELFLIPEEIEEVKATFGQLRAGQFPNQRENYWVTRDGARRLITWSNTAILDAQGMVEHIVATGIDVTKARQAEQQMRSLARFPSENPSPVMRISPDGLIIHANEASAGVLAMWATQVGFPIPDDWRALVANAFSAKRARTIVLPCGETIYSVDLVPIPNEDYVNFYASDITVQLRTEEALLKARDELETRVQERTRELAQANRALEAMSQSDRRQREAAEGLLQATLALNSSLDLNEVLDRILEQTRLAVHCPAVAVVPASEQTAHIARQRGLEDLVQRGESLGAVLSMETLYGPGAANGSLEAAPTIGTLLDPQRRGPSRLDWVRSYIATPLQVEQRLIGSLCAFSDEADTFSYETLHLAEGFAAHAATAIHNAALYGAALHAQGLAENLAAASVALSQTLDLDSVMNTLLDYLYQLVPYDGANIALVQDRNRLVLRAVRGQACLAIKDRIIDVERDSPVGTLLETQKTVLIRDVCTHPDWSCPAGAGDVVCWLGVPMIVGGQVIGVCELCRRGREPFAREHVQIAEALASQAAVAVQNAWLFDQVRAGQSRLQALSRRLVEVQEAERRYIARELHDQAAQVLISMKVRLSLLDRQVEQAVPARSTVNELRHALDSVLDDLNRLTTHLRPASLDHLGLDSALGQYVEGISRQHQISVAYEALGLSRRLAPDVETALYRIVQEALSNVVRHAHATRVDVLLERRGDRLIVLVEDNGVGFDALAAENSRSLGLAGLRERAEMLGGTFVVESSPGAGTTVLVEVPYDDSDTHRR
ncbi:MAG: GAF domain-containing protein, partial [Anaerolineae bacterium]|nr:GAF domain-containing protein [Anaerolineae bacterium]